MMTERRVAVFDAYGTLFDVHSAVGRLADRMGGEAARVSELWRQKQLEYSWTRSLMGRYADFWQLTEEALEHALAACGMRDAGLREALLESYRTLDIYPEVRAVLAGYRQRGLRVAVFSNANLAMLQEALAAARLDAEIDAVYSVESLRLFKPDARVYAAAAEAFDAAAEAIVFHSSNAWDAAGAASCGWRALWINRGGRPREYPFLPVEAVCDLGQALARTAAATT